MVIHTDSCSSLQVLQQQHPLSGSVLLITIVLDLIQHSSAQGCRVKLNRVHSHLGLQGKKWQPEQPPANLLCQAQPYQGGGQACCYQQDKVAALTDGGHLHTGGLARHCTCATSPSLARADQVLLLCLHLGYCTLDELRVGFVGRCSNMALDSQFAILPSNGPA